MAHDTLVCIIGNLRGGPAVWNSITRHLLTPLSAHLAILLSYDTPVPQELRPLHVWRVPERSGAWNDVVDKLYGSHNWSNRVAVRDNLWGGLASHMQRPAVTHGSGAIIFILRWWLLRYLDALGEGDYDTVVVTRNDLLYACDHPPLQRPFPRGVVSMPADEGYGGVTDRHTLFRWTERRRALAVLPWLIENDQRLRHIDNPEKALLEYYTEIGLQIRYIERSFVTVRRRNDVTRWRWSIGPNRCTPGMYLKYESEVAAARRFCNDTRFCPLFAT